MTGKALWNTLKELVSLDQQLFELDKNLSASMQEIESNQHLISQISSGLEEKKNQCHTEKRNVHAEELQAKSLRDEEEKKRKQLENCKNQAEYVGFKKELDLLKRQLEAQDDLVINAWHHLDSATKNVDTLEKKNADRTAELKIKIDQKSAEIKQIKENREIIVADRAKIAQSVPEEWLTRYKRMQNSVSDPIVPMHQSSCSACYYAVLKQDFNKLKQSGLLPCRQCYRFLYYDPEEEKNSQKATY